MGQGNLTEVMTCAPLASPLQKRGGEDSVLKILPAQCCLQFKLLLNEGVGRSSQVIKGPAAQGGKRQPPDSSLPPEVPRAALNNCLPL